MLERYNEYSDALKEICSQKKLQLSHKKLSNGYKFFYVSSGQPNVCFSAGIHGDEIAGPYAVLKFLQEQDFPKNALFFPIVNPYGFDRNIRVNSQKQDINRRFCDKIMTDEARIAFNLIKKCKLFVSLHEWSGHDGYYMYASDRDKKNTIEKIPKLASNYFKVLSNDINGEKVEEGVIWHPEEGYTDERSKCTLENKAHDSGMNYICTETPSRASLDRRVECQMKIIKFVLENLA